jgi:hypothetical protein
MHGEGRKSFPMFVSGVDASGLDFPASSFVAMTE